MKQLEELKANTQYQELSEDEQDIARMQYYSDTMLENKWKSVYENEQFTSLQPDEQKQAFEQFRNEMTHSSTQSPYQKFQKEYPRLDEYGRDVVSGRRFKQTIKETDEIMSRIMDDEESFNEALGFFGFGAMTAFHGSPHKFDKFSMKNIGTGEGAQAYGHGLYFAENPKVGSEYKYNLTRGEDATVKIDGVEIPSSSKRGFGQDIRKMGITDKDEIYSLMHLQGSDNIDDAIRTARQNNDASSDKIANWLENNRNRIEFEKGHLYEVDIPDEHIKNFLDWDAPLSEQPESVRKALRKSVPGIDDAIDASDGYLDFKDILHNFDDITQEELSKRLNANGVKGIKYFDGSSRAAGEGTRNLVVFDASIVKTLKRNNKAIK